MSRFRSRCCFGRLTGLRGRHLCWYLSGLYKAECMVRGRASFFSSSCFAPPPRSPFLTLNRPSAESTVRDQNSSTSATCYPTRPRVVVFRFDRLTDFYSTTRSPSSHSGTQIVSVGPHSSSRQPYRSRTLEKLVDVSTSSSANRF